jgi:hypothetical protein
VEENRTNNCIARRQDDREEDENSAAEYASDSTIDSTESQCSIREDDIVDFMLMLPDYAFGDKSTATAKTFANNMRRLPKRLINTTDANGNTMFLIACQYACVELVEILLKRKADAHWVNDSGANGLHFACYKDSLSLPIAETLLSLRVSANVPERLYGCTPLHYAASAGNLALCKLLIECGAYIHAHDYDGCDSIAYARDAGMTEVTEYLTQALALSQRPQDRTANLSTASADAASTAAAKAALRTAVTNENESLPPTPGSAMSKGKAKVRMIINTGVGSFDSTDDEGEANGSHIARESAASATPNRREVYDYIPEELQPELSPFRSPVGRGGQGSSPGTDGVSGVSQGRVGSARGSPQDGTHADGRPHSRNGTGAVTFTASTKQSPPSAQNASSGASKRNNFQPTNPSPYKPLPPSPVNINAAAQSGFNGATAGSKGSRGNTADNNGPPALPSPAFASPDGYGGYSDVESSSDLSPEKFELYIERAKFNARFQKEQALHREIIVAKDGRIQSLQSEVSGLRRSVQGYQASG